MAVWVCACAGLLVAVAVVAGPHAQSATSDRLMAGGCWRMPHMRYLTGTACTVGFSGGAHERGMTRGHCYSLLHEHTYFVFC